MLKLTEEQRDYLAHHKIPLSTVLDVSELQPNSPKFYVPIMEDLGKCYSIGATNCKRGHDSIKTRKGHCIQCNPAAISHFRRYYKDAFCYIAVSEDTQIVKVGYSENVIYRNKSLNAHGYGGITDWQIVYSIYCQNAGEIESKIQSRLSDYSSPRAYLKEGRVVNCYELFSCSYLKVKGILNDVKQEYTEKEFSDESEFPNAEERFNFPNVKTKGLIRKGNTIILGGRSIEASESKKELFTVNDSAEDKINSANLEETNQLHRFSNHSIGGGVESNINAKIQIPKDDVIIEQRGKYLYQILRYTQYGILALFILTCLLLFIKLIPGSSTLSFVLSISLVIVFLVQFIKGYLMRKT